MDDCRFCKSLEFRKELNARRTELDKQLFKVKYTVALVGRTLALWILIPIAILLAICGTSVVVCLCLNLFFGINVFGLT